MPRVVFLQVDCGGLVEHIVTDLAADGSGWDEPPAPGEGEEAEPAATVVLYAADGTELVAEQDATVVEATALADDAAAGATLLVVDDVTGLKRWDQIVVGPSTIDGRWEWATIDGLVEGGEGEGAGDPTIYLLAPLRYSYSEGDAVGTRALAVEFESTEIAEVQRNCRLEWRYTQGGVARRESAVVHCSRYAPRYALSDAEVEAAIPNALRMLGPYQRLTLILRQTWERKVLPTIARLMPPGGLVSGEAADEMLLAAVGQVICNAARDFEAADRWAAQYESLSGGLGDTITDLDEDGSQTDLERPRSRRGGRLLRG